MGTPQKSSTQFGIGDVIPTTSYSRLAPPGADAVDALNNKFASYSLGSDGLKGSKGYARRTSHFDSRPSLVSTPPSAGTAFTGIEEEDEEPEVAVIRQAGEQQQWDLEPLQDSNVDLNACKCVVSLSTRAESGYSHQRYPRRGGGGRSRVLQAGIAKA